jgi:filamin
MNLLNIYLIQLKAGDEPFINQSNQTSKSNYYPYQTQKNGTSSSQYLATSSSHIQNYSYGVNDSLEPFNLRIPVNEINSLGNKPVSARVKMPSGKVANPMVEQNPDGTVSIKYQPSEVGLHELDVFYNGQPIQGSPFKFHVDAINSLTGDQTSSGYVTAYGTGLTHGVCNQPCEFRIVTKDAGTGGLAVAVEGPSKAEIQCRDNKNGTCDVVFFPTAPGDYTITVKFADKHIVGSPFIAKISGDGRVSKRNQLVLGNQSDISLKVIEGDVNDLHATIKSPSGHEEPCLLKKLSNGSLGISFTPREVGEHLVSVLRDHKHIKNSPFRIEVRQSEIGDANRVKLHGKGLSEGTANKLNEFFVNTKEAGKTWWNFIYYSLLNNDF